MSRSSSPVSRRADVDEFDQKKRKRSTSPMPRDRSLSPPTHRRRSRSPERYNDRDAPKRSPGAPAAQVPPVVPGINLPKVVDIDPFRRRERERQLAERALEEQTNGDSTALTKKSTYDAAAEFAKLVSTRSGGAYIPPSRLRAMQKDAEKDKSSVEWQRMTWDALRKSINGLINKVNVANIKYVVPEMFNENLIRGRGLFARAIMKAQASSLPFTPVFSALIAIINTKLPMVGELVLIRLISQFRRALKRDDKIVCQATASFIAHLVNQSVAHEIVALQMLVLMLEQPTDDSVEIAVGFMREVGAYLAENSPKANNGVFERFRAVLHEGAIDKRVQYMIEVLFQVRRDKFKDNPIIPEGLDLVEEDEQITHRIALDDELQVQDTLNVFKEDPKFLQNEEKYAEIKEEILGGDSDDESGSEEGSDEEDDEDVAPEKEGIQDMTETDLVNLRRSIYLTLMNSLGFEEAVHKLMNISVPEGKEIEMINMIIECCSQERSYTQFYGLIAERFCKLNRIWTDASQEAFANYYDTIHRYETNRLRNIARLFGHLIASDAISWAVLHAIHMNEEETTSSSRIFVKIMMQEVMEEVGLKKMAARLKEPDLQQALTGIFPTDNPKNTRFAINYFTSIGLGLITEDMRTWLQNAPKLIMAQRQAALEAESSDSDSSSDSSSNSDSSSDSSDSDSDSDSDSSDSRSRSRSPPRRRRSPSPRRGNGRGDRSISRSPPRRRRYSDDRSPPPARRSGRDDRSPPRRRYDDSRSPARRKYDDDRVDKRDGGRRRYDSRSPPPRRRYDEDSPPPRRRSPVRDDRDPRDIRVKREDGDDRVSDAYRRR